MDSFIILDGFGLWFSVGIFLLLLIAFAVFGTLYFDLKGINAALRHNKNEMFKKVIRYSGEIERYKASDAFFRNEIQRLAEEIKQLESRDELDIEALCAKLKVRDEEIAEQGMIIEKLTAENRRFKEECVNIPIEREE